MNKALFINFEKCTGCHSCEMVCSLVHDHECSLVLSRVVVMKTGGGGSDENILLVCQQCHDPFCIEVCVMGAISWNEQIGALVINENLCMGCKTCLIACPFGGTLYHPKKEFAVKCDLCGGNPACVEVCLYGALEFLSPEEEGIKKQQRLAERFAKITVR